MVLLFQMIKIKYIREKNGLSNVKKANGLSNVKKASGLKSVKGSGLKILS